MKVLYAIAICLASTALSSCGQSSSGEETPHAIAAPHPTKGNGLTLAMLSTPKDLVCGMDLKDGEIADTAHYEGKVYGFCGSGCKEEFQKKPAETINQK
jgi:hypothetical protein